MGNYGNFNSSSSYQADSELSGSVVDLITGQENQDFKYREEGRQMATLIINQKNHLDKQKQDRISAIQKDFDENKLKYPNSTGADSYDALTLRTFESVKAKLFDAEQTILKATNDPGSVKPDELEKSKLLKFKTKDLAERYNFINKSLKEKVDNYKTDLVAGTVHLSTEIQSMLMNGYDKIVPQVDESGNINIGFADDKGKIYKSFTEEELKGRINELTPMPRTDYMKYLDGASKDVKDAIVKLTTDKNYLKHEQEYVADDTITNYVNNLSDKDIKSFARQFNESGAIDPVTKQKYNFDLSKLDPATIKKKAFEDIKARMTSTDKKEFDYGAQTADISNRETARHNKAVENKDKEQPPMLTDVELNGYVTNESASQEWLVPPKEGGNNGPDVPGIKNPYYGAKGGVIYNTIGGNLKRVIGNPKTGLTQVVESITLLPDGINMIFKVSTPNKVTTKTDNDGNITEQGGGVDYEYIKTKGAVGTTADFYTKVINPKTKKYYRNSKEFINSVKELSQNKPQAQNTMTPKIKIPY